MTGVTPHVLHVIFSTFYKYPRNAFRIFGEGNARKLAADSARAQTFGDGDEVALQSLLEDFEREPPVQLHSRGAQEGADGAGCAPLFSNDLTKIARGHSQLQHGDLLALNFANSNLLGNVHQGFGDLFNEFSQLILALSS